MDLEATDAAGNRGRIRAQLRQAAYEYPSGTCHLTARAGLEKTMPGYALAFRTEQSQIKITGSVFCGEDVTEIRVTDMCLQVNPNAGQLVAPDWRPSFRNCYSLKHAKHGRSVTFPLRWVCQRPSDGVTGFRILGRMSVYTNIPNPAKTLASDQSTAVCPKESERQAAETAGWRELVGPNRIALRLLRNDLGSPPTQRGWAAHHIIPKKDPGPGASLAQSIGFRCHVFVNSRHNGVYLRNKGGPLGNGTSGFYDLLPALRRRAQHWGYGDPYALALLPWLQAPSVLDRDGNCRSQRRAYAAIAKIGSMLIGTWQSNGHLLQSEYPRNRLLTSVLMSLCSNRIICAMAAIATLGVAGCGGQSARREAHGHPATGITVAAQRQDLTARWNSRTATQPPSSGGQAATPRERISNRLIADDDLLPLGTSMATVRRLLGSPSKRTQSGWSYLAARWSPDQSFGAICTRYFIVQFDEGKVSDLTLEPARCPLGVNP